MEEQLKRIADSFESIAASLEAIQRNGLEIWSHEKGLSVDLVNLENAFCYFPTNLSVELRNSSDLTGDSPFLVQSYD